MMFFGCGIFQSEQCPEGCYYEENFNGGVCIPDDYDYTVDDGVDGHLECY